MLTVLSDPLFLIAFCAVVGQLVGSIRFGYFKLGSSATLFVGLFLSYYLTTALGQAVHVPSAVFSLSLIGFIVSVGLSASGSIKQALKSHGLKFLILSIVITCTGAFSTFMMARLFPALRYNVFGTYVGALTSSPGLAVALELAKTGTVDHSSAVGLGYSVAYIPGVLNVIVFSQVLGKIAGVKKGGSKASKTQSTAAKPFRILSFFLVIFLGILLGSISFGIGGGNTFSLGITGGVLFSALILGSWNKNNLFSFDDKHLGIIRDISLNMFLAIVGLNYGYDAFISVSQLGLRLLLIGLLTGVSSIVTGYLVGRYVLKIDLVYLAGGLCGSMTSTPGLAAAIDAFDSEEVVTGYGACYPFALLLKILLIKLLYVL